MTEKAQNAGVNFRDPVVEAQRIQSIDILRGVALLGILLLNVVGMAFPDPAYWDPSGWGGDTGWNLRVFFVNALLFEGTMRGIFSMLFGAGVILFTVRKEEEGAGPGLAWAWYRRTIWLLVFGLIHAYLLIWPGEILYQYGIAGLLLFPVRHVRPQRLIAFALFIFLASAVLNVFDYREALELHERAQTGDRVEWEEYETAHKPSEESKQEEVDGMHAGYFSAVLTMAPLAAFLQTSWFIPQGFLDVLGMMLLGMGLYRLGVFHGKLPWKYYVLFVLVGYGVGIPVNWHETTSYIQGGFSVLSYLQTGQSYELGRLFTTMGHVGLVMLCIQGPFFGFLKRSLAAVGRMALSNYIMHTVIATTVFVIFRQYGQWERYQLYFLVLGIWIVQLIVSPIWLRHYRFGPLEWLWRWLTYRKRPALRRN